MKGLESSEGKEGQEGSDSTEGREGLQEKNASKQVGDKLTVFPKGVGGRAQEEGNEEKEFAAKAPVNMSSVEPSQPNKSENTLASKKTKKNKEPFWKKFGKKKSVDESDKKKKKPESKLMAALSSINNMGMGKQVHMFVQSTATMLNAGLPLLEALKTFQMETRSKPMKKMVSRIITDVGNGSPFWRAMDSQHLFTQYDIAMVRIGEEAGSLAQNMVYLSQQREKDRSLRQQVKMAMVYPTIVMVMMFIIVMGLGLFVLPNLVQVLFSLNVELPLMTRIVIYITNIFSDYGKIFVPLLILGFIFFILLGKFTRFKVVSQWIVFHIPGIGRLGKEASIARFGVVLGGLLQAGVPVVEALTSLVNVTQIVAQKKLYVEILEHIKIGDSFQASFEKCNESERILSVSVQQLIIAGEKSGSLAESLLQIATIYEKKASETAKALPVILEPILLLFIGGLVAAIAFAIIVPIYSVVGNISGA